MQLSGLAVRRLQNEGLRLFYRLAGLQSLGPKTKTKLGISIIRYFVIVVISIISFIHSSMFILYKSTNNANNNIILNASRRPPRPRCGALFRKAAT